MTKNEAIPASKSVKQGDRVLANYTGRTEGKIFDSSIGRQPLEFSVGKHEVIRGFEEALESMKVGEKKTIIIAPDKAYGPHIEKLVVKIPRQAIKLDTEIKPGMRIEMTDPQGQMRLLTVVAIDGDAVTIDLNHPLAGKTLEFEVEILNIQGDGDSG